MGTLACGALARYCTRVRKLDVFNHIYPQPYFDRMMAVSPTLKDIGKRMRNIPMLIDLDERLRVMDRFDGYQQVLSIATPPIEAYAAGSDAVDLARLANDGMAALVARHPDRFPAFVASLPLGDPDAAMRETERAVRDLGARGIQLFSNINGRPLDAPEHLALFDRMAAFDLPVWLHPYRGAEEADYASETRSRFEIWWAFGWPYETSVAMARLVFSGIFDRHPALKIITHHLGAMVPYFEGRVGPGWDQLGARTSDEDYGGVLKGLAKRPIDYFRMFYADTAVFGAYDATVCGLRFFGSAHVLFASDAPFDPKRGPRYIRDTIAVLDRLPLASGDLAHLLAERRGTAQAPSGLSLISMRYIAYFSSTWRAGEDAEEKFEPTFHESEPDAGVAAAGRASAPRREYESTRRCDLAQWLLHLGRLPPATFLLPFPRALSVND
jgi:uncharacterized protein